MQIINHKNNIIKAWTDNLEIEETALQQLYNLSEMPFIHKHIAVMPDVHAGMGSTVGSVIPTYKAIIPAAIGVDIGCGMMAVKTSLIASDFPDNLSEIRSAIEQAVPHGRSDNGGINDRGAWRDIPPFICTNFMELESDLSCIVQKYPEITQAAKKSLYHLGTLGTGNHFIELCLDQNQNVWVMLHSGSRGIGNKIGSYFIELAKEEMKRWYINIPHKDLAYLPEGSQYFKDYLFAVNWAQKYAKNNRILMMKSVFNVLTEKLPQKITILAEAINCHHNYVERENHFGANVWVTRKGAVRAREGDLGIIPGSMGAKSFIVRGKGNPESFDSCSHGAGRKMSRTKARALFTLDDHIKATEGIECRKDSEVIDETPMAYKDIDTVMEAQSDLVEILYTLKQIVCVKG